MSIRIASLSKRIKGVDILHDIDLHVPNGYVMGLAGVNGSGKTTLMRAVAGLIRPTSGTIDVDGVRLWRDASFPPSIGILIENPAFLDSRTGFDNLRLLASVKGGADEDRIRDTLRTVGLDPHDRRKFRTYSLGMKQRLGLAAAVMERPSIVVLDEPTNALDADGVSMLKSLVKAEKARGAAMLVSCHDAAILHELSDEVAFMENGHITKRERANAAQSAESEAGL